MVKDKVQFRMSSAGKCPRALSAELLGCETRKNKHGHKQIFCACADCGKKRWVNIIAGQLKSIHCIDCGRKKAAQTLRTLHRKPTFPKGTVDNPEIGDIRYGDEISKQSTIRHIYVQCPLCKVQRWVRYIKGQARCTKCRGCFNKENRLGKKHPNWKGGRIICKNNYIFIRIYPNNPYFPMTSKMGYVSEHRLIIAQELGRCLETKEIVHHINGNKHDNRHENLLLVSAQEHRTDYLSGYKEGHRNGQKAQNQELVTEIRLLRLQLKQLRENQNVR